jgi:hypothetical protein
MLRMILAVGVLFGFTGLAFGVEQVLVSEDFESGLGNWNTVIYSTGLPTNDAPLWFDGTGASAGDPIYGPNTGYPGTHSAGFSSDLSPWDGSQPQWLDKRWPALLPPGTYDVTLTFDRYTYILDDHDYWGLGNRAYILTDGQYNNPALLYDNNPYPPPGSEGDGIRSTRWQGDGNGTWDRNRTAAGQLITTTGNIELRLMMHEKYAGQQTVAWDNVRLVIRDPSQGGAIVLSFSDDFEAGLGQWTPMTWRTATPNNDTVLVFSGLDPLLYANANNNGSHSAGFSSNLAQYDGTKAEWLTKRLPAVVQPGTYDYRLEFERYVSRGGPSNDTPIEIPASGARLNGPNTGFPGSKAVGYSSNSIALDLTRGQWIQKQFPTTGLTGVLSATIECDMYIYKQDTTDAQGLGNRIFVLTGSKYNNPTWDFTSNATPGWCTSYHNSSFNGQWQHITYTQDITSDGNIELRLLCYDNRAGLQSVAWDNVRLTVGGTQLLFDDFEGGLAGWTTKSYVQTDLWAVGNRVYLLTDDQYNAPFWNFDVGSISPGLALSFWPGDSDWLYNGVWHHEVFQGQLVTNTGNVELRLLQHDKGAGAQAVAWDNVALTLLTPCNAIRFDSDNDGDVDQLDFAAFQTCYTGDGGTFDPQQCRCFNSDGDGDIDQLDLSAFAACASGPGITAAIGCDDSLSPP